MNEKLDKIHHTAIQVQNISKAVLWYTQHFKCKIEYQDSSWAMLKFANTSLALVSADQHPYHFYDPFLRHRMFERKGKCLALARRTFTE